MNNHIINAVQNMTKTAKTKAQWKQRLLIARQMYGNSAIYYADASIFMVENDMSISVHPYHAGGLDTPIVGYDIRHYSVPDWDDDYSIATNYPVSEIVLA